MMIRGGRYILTRSIIVTTMVELGPVYTDSDAFEPDPIYPDCCVQIEGILLGELFTPPIVHLQNLSGTGSIRLPTTRRVMIAVLHDENGVRHVQKYSPDEHGPEVDLPRMNIVDFENQLEETGDIRLLQELSRVRKKKTSRPGINTDDDVCMQGGDSGFRIPKKVYSHGKLL